MSEYNILLLEGDGIGKEICQEVKKIIKIINDAKIDCQLNVTEGLIGGIAYDETGTPLPEKTIKQAKESDTILLGAVGGTKWETLPIDVRPEKGLLGIRKKLELFANLRPIMVFDELINSSSLKPEIVKNLDILIVRELTGGIYFGQPRGVTNVENHNKKGINTLVYTTDEIKRVAKVAFELAQKRNKKLCSVDKANVLEATELWRNEVQNLHKEKFLNVELNNMYVDNAAMQLVSNPKQFDVIVTTNMFGDILSDIAATLTGSLGMLPSASLGIKQENGKQYALYEPVHGSAPDIAGQNKANPVATILSLYMMLCYSFNLKNLAEKLMQAVKLTLKENIYTADIVPKGYKPVSTTQMGDKISENLKQMLNES